MAGDRRLAAQAFLVLLHANIRYWSTVAPVVRRQLRHWERRARAIPDPELRALALAKLHTEGFNAEAAAMLATLAPRANRRHAVQAIVALELLFDYLDGLTERPLPDPLGEGARLYAAYTTAIDPDSLVGWIDPRSGLGDPHLEAAEGYLQELSQAVVGALARLPARDVIARAAAGAAERSAQAQIRMHAARSTGTVQLEEWANGAAHDTPLGWRELLAGAASSVLALHALIAAAADPRTTPSEALEIDTAYLSICVVVTLLDGLVDHTHDSSSTGPTYFSLYEDQKLLMQTLTNAVRRAFSEARALPNGAHHLITLTGVIAYYASAPGANSDLARPVMAGLMDELGPLASPPLLVTRAWRAAKRAYLPWRRTSVRAGPET